MSASSYPGLALPKKPRPKLAEFYASKRVQKSCLECGKLRAPEKASHAAKHKFCSTKCAVTYKLKSRPACPICGKPRQGYRLTCSEPCGYEFRKRRLRNPKSCPECGVEFWPDSLGGKFSKHCSWRCAKAARARSIVRVQIICLQCGKVSSRMPAMAKRVKQHFCSQECCRTYLRGPNSPLYRGEADPNRGGQWRRLAEEIRKRDGYCCQRCNRTQAENKQKLSVDHIFPWRTFTDKAEANDPRNLVSLCRRCHSIKTHVYERLWLRGDRIGMEQYRKAIQLPPLFARVDVPA